MSKYGTVKSWAMRSWIIATILVVSHQIVVSPAVSQSKQPNAATALGVDSGALLGDPAGTPLTGNDLVEQADEVASQIRCPMCRGLPISASPTESAAAMRAETEQLLAKGYTQKQVMAYFEATYGEFVLLDPKTKGNLPLYFAPFVLFAVGGLIVYFRLRPARATDDEEPELADYADRVRLEVANDSTAGSTSGVES